MVWSEKEGGGEGEGEGEAVAVRFLRRAVIAVMSCFFGCFRVKDSHSHLVSCPSTEPVVAHSRNALSSLFLSDDDSGQGAEKNRKLDNPQLEGLDVRELKDEAKFLNACGTLPETPAEIRKASEKLKDTSSEGAEAKPLKFNSWLPNASVEKLHLEKQYDEPPTPVKIYEEQVKESGSSVETPSSCMTDGLNARRASSNSNSNSSSSIQNVITPTGVHNAACGSPTSSVPPEVSALGSQFKNKSVRFERESDISSLSSKSSSCDQNSKQFGLERNYNTSKQSPYPTPLKLTDEMQTPGTVFPAYLDNRVDGKTARIRSQYVYSVPNPVEDASQWKILKEESSDFLFPRESLEEVDKGTPAPDMGMKEISVRKDVEVETNLSSWLKPPSVNQDDNNQWFGSGLGRNIHCGKTQEDRPILGMVAAHWNEEETSRISPKWWDGNGIPNSTNKYKEDQKVSWHATPFEERLEKALSEETFVSQRKQISGSTPLEFAETEESDTALSQLQPSAHCKPVISF